MCVCMYIYIYVYIYRERQRKRQTDRAGVWGPALNAPNGADTPDNIKFCI